LWLNGACYQGLFPEKKNSGNAEFDRRAEGTEGGGVKIFRFWTLNRRILVQTERFLYSSPKAGLSAVIGTGEGQNSKH